MTSDNRYKIIMEDLLTNIDWVIRKYGENVEKIDFIDFHLHNGEDITDIKYNKVGTSHHGYVIDCERLSNLILLPVDTKIYLRMDNGPRWTNYSDIVAFALIKPERTHTIDLSLLMGGGYVVMNRYIIDSGDQIKFVTKRKIDQFHVTFTNVLKIGN